MGGCASMVCGRDYHGGNDQSGCGQSFTWEQAKPYVATSDQKPEEVMRDLLNPEHKLVAHENIKWVRVKISFSYRWFLMKTSSDVTAVMELFVVFVSIASIVLH
jgi:hypothetical protein